MPKVSEEHLERRRQQILDAAVTCFARQGFHATSMQDIFAEAGLSAGAVYRYFPSKTELIRAIATQVLGSVLPTLRDVVGTGAVGSIPDLAEAMLTPLYDGYLARLRPVIIQVWAEAARDEELAGVARSVLGQLIDGISRVLDKLAADGRIRAGTDTAAVARLIVAMLQGYIMQFAILGPVSPAQLRAAAADAFGGLAFVRRILLGRGERLFEHLNGGPAGYGAPNWSPHHPRLTSASSGPWANAKNGDATGSARTSLPGARVNRWPSLRRSRRTIVRC